MSPVKTNHNAPEMGLDRPAPEGRAGQQLACCPPAWQPHGDSHVHSRTEALQMSALACLIFFSLTPFRGDCSEKSPCPQHCHFVPNCVL